MAKRPTADGGVSKVMEMMKEHSVEFVDLRFTDPRGKWQHTAQQSATIDEDAFKDGIMFDGSSIAGWKAINESDMILMPDPRHRRAWIRSRPSRRSSSSATSSSRPPASPTAAIRARPPRRPRPISTRPASATPPIFGPEAEFFVFDGVRYGTGGNYGMLPARQHRGPAGLDQGISRGQHGPPPGDQGRLFPGPAGR